MITFEKLLGTLENDGAADVQPTADGGFILCGNTVNLDEDLSDGYLVKTNAWGEIEWTKVYDSNDNKDNSDNFRSLIVLEDGYLVVGNTDNGTRDQDIWVVKTNLAGIVQWDTLYGGNDNDEVGMILPTKDGNFVMVGAIVDNLGNKDGYLVKLDDTGTEIWSKAIGGSNAEVFNAIALTDEDDGYIICGVQSSSALAADILLVKTDSLGNVSWQKTHGTPGDYAEGASSLLIAPDGGFILAGSTTSLGAGARDAYIIKTDASGNKDESWGDKTFGAEHQDGFGKIIRTKDGGYLAVGSTEDYYVDYPVNEWYRDVFIVKLDQNGAFEWDKVYGGDHHEGAGMVRGLEDGSFVICGSSDSYGASGDGDIYFLRIGPEGNLITAIETNRPLLPGKMHLSQNYPNPFNGSTTIRYSISKNSLVKLQVFDLSGRIVKNLVNDFQAAGDYSLSFDTAGLASGLYLYRLTTDNLSETKRLLLIK